MTKMDRFIDSVKVATMKPGVAYIVHIDETVELPDDIEERFLPANVRFLQVPAPTKVRIFELE